VTPGPGIRWPALSVQYYCAASLDGYIAEVDDTLDWLTGYTGVPPGRDLSPVEGGYHDFYADVGALVSGSVTYEFILGELERGTEWPYAGKPCWVLSSRKLSVPEGHCVDVRIRHAPASSNNCWPVSGSAAGRCQT
jgi:dihydrofolate reductase